MLFKMQKIIIIFVGILLKCKAQNPIEGDCYLEGVTEEDWLLQYTNNPVDDNEAEEFKRFLQQNIEDFEVKGPDYGKYFKVELTDDYVIISPTEEFTKYELEQESVPNPQMYISLSFKCTNSKTKRLAFYQPIRDLNTYSPEFEKSSYTYELPMPLPANFDVAVFGDQIEACDMDISNTFLEFSIIPDDDFSITYGEPISGSKNKCHKAVIKTKSYLRLTSNKDYKITVTDKGGDSTTADFKIEIDEQTTLPPNPQFEFAYYTAKYISENDPHTIDVDGFNLKEGCSKVTLNIIGDHGNRFDINCVEEKVIVTLNTNLPDDVLENDSVVLLTVEAILENAEDSGKTALVVYLPKKECPEVTTIAPTECPPTVTPTECPVCPTESTTSYTCPPCNTECPSTPAECPPCSTPPVECTTLPSTECPPCITTPGECPSISTECPLTCPPCSTIPSIPTESSVTCSTSEVSTECPICPTTPGIPPECPVITCPPCSTTPGECSSTSTECPICPLTCPPCTTIPGDCSSVPTECPVTCPTSEDSTECPICPTTPGIPPECPVITCPPCSTTPGECSSTSTECPLTCPPCSTIPGDCSSVVTECPVTCPEVSTDCPICPTTPSIPTEFPHTCPLCSSTPGDCPSITTECPVTCPAPELTTECPLCPTTSGPPLPETIIKFEQDLYKYKLQSWHVGNIIGIVKATVTPKEDIEYSIKPDTEFLECNKNTGELTMIKANVIVGTYTFTAYAIGVDTETSTQTIVAAEILEDHENAEPDTKYSVMVEHVVEDQEEEAEIELPCHYTYCKYTLGQQHPETADDIFRVENNILHVGRVKREREDIIELLVPQFSLHFFLTDVGSPIELKHNRSDNSSFAQTKVLPQEWAFIPNTISHLPNQLFLSVIILDINNNYPIFEVGSELVVGYPTAELASQLTPPYVAKVVATDKDLDENARIMYSTESKHFTIHPKTGVIYPAEDAFNDDSNLKFTVTATDKDGADDGLSTDLKIEVKLLKKENLIVLMVKNLMLEEIDDTMEKLSKESDLKISYLTAAVIPIIDNTKNSLLDESDNLIRQFKGFFKSIMTPKASSDHYSKIIVYALDSDNKPVETDDLQEILEDTGVLEDFTTDKWEPGSSSEENNGSDDDPSTAGFIAAISVLASLLVIFIVTAAAFYYFKIYKVKNQLEPYTTMEEEDTHSVNFEKNPRASSVSKYEDPAPQRRVTGYVFNPPPIEEDEDEFGEKTYENTTDYGVKQEWPKSEVAEYVESKYPQEDLYGENTVKYEESPTDYDGERRKSVKFKETVEKINIVVDDRQDEDILDERL